MYSRIAVLGLGAFAGLAITTPALAADEGKGGYIAVEGGLSVKPKTRFNVATTPKPTTDGIIVKNKSGKEFALVGGYDFGPVRTEIELAQRTNSVTSVTSTVDLPTKFNTAPAVPTVAKGTFANATGSTRVKTAMLNVIGDLGDAEGANFFLGAGIGFAKVNARNYSISSNAVFLNDNDKSFAWQLMAGARAPLSETVEVGLKYNYLKASGIDMADTLKRGVSSGQTAHSVRATLGFKF